MTTTNKKDLQSEILQLEAWAQEELAAQRDLVKSLKLQENAIRGGSTQDLLDSSLGVQAAAKGSSQRERRRIAGLRALSRRFGVAVETLTLRSISERASAAGLDCSRLDRFREEIRTTVADTLKRGRRIATVARHHCAVVDDLFGELAGQAEESPDRIHRGPLLVNREA